MQEDEPRPGAGEAPGVRPPYEQISQKLTTLFETAGGTVTEAFPQFAPKGALSTYDPRSRTLTFHPWISPRRRVEELLHQTVSRLTEQQIKKRKKRSEDSPRIWLMEGDLNRRYGLSFEDSKHVQELTVWEKSIVDHITASLEPKEESKVVFPEPAADDHLEADYDDRASGYEE